MMSRTSDELLAVRPSAVDLFCGAGGLSYGMQQAGVVISGGIDLDPSCRHPFEENVKAAFHERDIFALPVEFVGSLFAEGRPRVLAGCAPCQPFSTYTNGRRPRGRQWRLLHKFGEMIQELRPEIVTMENVPLLTNHWVFEDFVSLLKGLDYSYDYSVVRCSDYGVPQSRKRLVLLASKFGDIGLVPPARTEAGAGARAEAGAGATTVRGTIGHLERIGAGGASLADPLHRCSSLSARNQQRIRSSEPGGTWRDWDDDLRSACHAKVSGRSYTSVYGRMRWDGLAPTITTQFHGYGNGRFGHPEQDRAISLREGALLQTFPEHYSFVPEGSAVRIAPVARLIGNAVPVKLGTAIGESINAHLEAFT